MYRYPRTLTNLIEMLESLPGVGPKSAAKLALFLHSNSPISLRLSESISAVLSELDKCSVCGNVVEKGVVICDICSDSSRQHLLMLVETVFDMVNIENTGAFFGKYHILNGLVSPVRGVSMSKLNTANLLERISEESLSEVVSALPSNIEGDTTALLIKQFIQDSFPNVLFSKLGRGIPSGANIEFLDPETVKNSILNKFQF
jgi:recombination protein RecR